MPTDCASDLMTSLCPKSEFSVSRSMFPEDFLFAVATSAYQIEGHASGGAGQTHWDSLAKRPGAVIGGETGAIACDHYHRWEEDLDLIATAGFDAYRFSTSWARIQPDGVNVNPEGLDFYDRLVDGMLARGLRPMATLYHWELPLALADTGGWTRRETAERFAEFAELVGRRLGDRLYSVVPINEPWCVAWLSHYLGYHAPGDRDLSRAVRAMHYVALGHGLAVERLRDLGVSRIGTACNMEYALPASECEEDLAAARLFDGIYNRWFAGGMIHGAYPEDVLAGFAPQMPDQWQDDMKIISQPIDWFGVNYYTCQRVTWGDGPWPDLTSRPGTLPKTDMGWEVCPDGLSWLLTRLADEYTGRTPIFITENGMANSDTDNRPDGERISYLDSHLRAVLDLVAKGIPVQGYTVWSLLDNFEWTFGYTKRFGLVHVDFETQKRTLKASYHALVRALSR